MQPKNVNIKYKKSNSIIAEEICLANQDDNSNKKEDYIKKW